MKKIAYLLVLLSLCFNAIADSNKITEVKQTIDQIGSDLLIAELAPSSMSKEEILTMIKSNEELNSYLYQSFIEVNYNIDKLQKFYFSQDSWYPQFCNAIGPQENITKCFETIAAILNPLGKKFGFLYMNGDADSSDFKNITLVFEQKDVFQKLIVTLKIHEERN